jgi:hypothetical protein
VAAEIVVRGAGEKAERGGDRRKRRAQLVAHGRDDPGLDLLPELHDSAGEAIPIIIYSAQGANPVYAAQVQAALAKSRGSIDSLIATLRTRLIPRAAVTICGSGFIARSDRKIR